MQVPPFLLKFHEIVMIIMTKLDFTWQNNVASSFTFYVRTKNDDVIRENISLQEWLVR